MASVYQRGILENCRETRHTPPKVLCFGNGKKGIIEGTIGFEWGKESWQVLST